MLFDVPEQRAELNTMLSARLPGLHYACPGTGSAEGLIERRTANIGRNAPTQIVIGIGPCVLRRRAGTCRDHAGDRGHQTAAIAKSLLGPVRIAFVIKLKV